MDKSVKYVSGNFIGNFFTHQKSPLSIGEKIPDGELHHVHLYKGDLTEAISIDSFTPEEHLNREGMLLHNVTNVQIHLLGEVNQDKKIYDFDQLVLKNVKVESSFEQNGKTYGILKGELVGKIKKISSVSVSDNDDGVIPPPPIGGNTAIPTPPIITDDSRWNKYIPPVITDSSKNGGCLSSIWDILKWLLLLFLILFLLKQCNGCGKNNDNDSSDNDCYVQTDSLTKVTKRQQSEIDSLKNLIIYRDSICNSNIERERLQCEIDNLSSEIYFYGNKTQIRKYSENQIDKIVELLRKSNEIELEILGYHNGNDLKPIYYSEFDETMTIDKARALTVKQILVNKGIDSNLMTAKGMGESNIDSADEESMAKIFIDGEEFRWNRNMRVEIKIIKY